MAHQQLAQSDPALDAFERLRLRAVQDRADDTASTFLAEFQSTAASLEPNERIKLVVHTLENTLELLKAVLADPHANKICSLHWEYGGEEDVDSIIPLLIVNCPELASLQVYFKYHCAFGFATSVLEHPSNKVKVLEIPQYADGDLARFFAELKQSQVSVLTLCNDGSSEFSRGLCEYLAKGMMVRLTIELNSRQVPFTMMKLLAKCTCLVELSMSMCEFSQPTAFARLPKSITKLVLHGCEFVGGFKWSFLAESNVRELGFYELIGVNANQLGSALAVHLRAKGLDKLCICNCRFVNEALAVVGAEIGRVKRLNLRNLNDASIALIAHTLRSPNIEMTKLRLTYAIHTARSIETLLVPALKHPNCSLTKLRFVPNQEHKVAAFRVQDAFHNRRVLFVLLQGQQLRRKSPCQLRRLPVEMFRMVGMVLIGH